MPGHINKKQLIMAMVIQAAMTGLNLDSANAQTSRNRESEIPSIIYTKIYFDIPSLLLIDSLNEFSRQTGIAITILPGTPEDARSVAVHGRISPEMALARLLGPHQVPYRFSGGALIVGQSGDTGTTQVLPAITVNAPVPNVAMPNDSGSSGLSVIDQDTIKVIGTGDKDPIRLLRVLPNVNFDNSQFKVGQSGGTGTLSEQDLTPERVSISGGKVYDNKLTLDGMDNMTVFDVTNTSEGDADKIGIHNPMALFANNDILEEVAVYDSNVPARYSGFTGGVIDMRTRAPSNTFGGSIGYGHQTDRWVHYRNDWDTPGASVESPKFTKDSYDLAVDLPVAPRLRTLFAASRVEAESFRIPTANYEDGSKSGTISTRSSYLGSLSADVTERTTVELRGLYAPYTQEFTRANMADDTQETGGDKYQLNGAIHHHGNAHTANLLLGFSSSGYERDAPSTAYTWRRTASKMDTCSGGTSCVEGGYGDIADEQTDLQVKGDISAPVLGVEWSTGLDYHRIGARRSREQTNTHYFNPTTATQTVVCTDPTDITCIAGEQALRSRNTYLARDYSATVNNAGYWFEGAKSLDLNTDILQGIDLRAGIRADYGDYLDNLNWAPRLSTTIRFPSSVALTLGANRYYSTDTLTYALYEKAPMVMSQSRGTTVGSVWTSTDWSTPAPRYQYVPADVRTPYSDERTAALTLPFLWGEGRLKYLVRHNRDEIAMKSYAEGGISKRKPTNMGWTNYKSFSIEWMKSLERNAFLINGTWSNTKRNSTNYFESPDEEETTRVYYQGAVVNRGSLPLIADNFAQPLTINAVWTSKWLEDALTLNLTGKYRFAREDIASTDSTINVGGTDYTVYDKVTRNPQLRFDATATYRIDTWSEQQLELQAYVENIFNARSYTAESTAPYERGRAYWFGVRYLF